jgi:hypothetical protein
MIMAGLTVGYFTLHRDEYVELGKAKSARGREGERERSISDLKDGRYCAFLPIKLLCLTYVP